MCTHQQFRQYLTNIPLALGQRPPLLVGDDRMGVECEVELLIYQEVSVYIGLVQLPPSPSLSIQVHYKHTNFG